MGEQYSIVALASGTLPCAIAVIKVSGPECAFILAKFLDTPPIARRLCVREIVDPVTGGVIDKAMVVSFPGPGSFTGEDCLEFHVHGSRAIVNRLLQRLQEIPLVRLAEPGEFARRAFENGRMDLTEIEGLGDLIAADTESQRVLALARMSGELGHRIKYWRQQLVNCLANIEAYLDFSEEEDVGEADIGSLITRVTGIIAEFRTALAGFDHGRIVREGFRVGIGGAPNVGKSSLLNYLVGSDAAIVTEEAGTTRDVKEVAVDLAGQLVIFFDGAGIRDATSKAEIEGVRRAKLMLAGSDLVIWLRSVLAPDDDGWLPDGKNVLEVVNKCDLAPGNGCGVEISVKTGMGMDNLLLEIKKIINKTRRLDGSVLLSRARDREAIDSGLRALEAALNSLKQEGAQGILELIAEDLRRAIFSLQRLLGLGIVDAENVLDELFSGFCIGK